MCFVTLEITHRCKKVSKYVIAKKFCIIFFFLFLFTTAIPVAVCIGGKTHWRTTIDCEVFSVYQRAISVFLSQWIVLQKQKGGILSARSHAFAQFQINIYVHVAGREEGISNTINRVRCTLKDWERYRSFYAHL